MAQSHLWDFTTHCINFSVRDSASKLLLFVFLCRCCCSRYELVNHYHMNAMVCGIIQIMFCLHVCVTINMIIQIAQSTLKVAILCASFGPVIIFGALMPIIMATGEII